nr:hypothetical protein [Tanacetum cinerariifolium]
MSRSLFTGIVEEVTLQCAFFHEKEDCTEKLGISPLIKCTSAIRQLAYDIVPDALDEYLQMGNATSRQCLERFYTSLIQIFRPEFLRKPTLTDVERLYAFHENKHGLPKMLGSLDCTVWAWFGCLIAHKAQYCRRDHGPDPIIFWRLLHQTTYGYGSLFWCFLVEQRHQRYTTIPFTQRSQTRIFVCDDVSVAFLVFETCKDFGLASWKRWRAVAAKCR